MDESKQLPKALFLLRITVFLVFLMWTIDKFIRPSHAGVVFQKFYFSPAFQDWVFYLIGLVESIILIGFLLGIKKKLTYGIVFLLHFISTVSSYRQYLAPFEQGNLLFFAAWPMLAACYALYVLRDQDTIGTLKSW